MNSSQFSKVLRIAALGAGSLAFVAALAMTSNHMAAAQAQPAEVASIDVTDTGFGPLGATCRSLDGRACLRDGLHIHCATSDGSVGDCFCVELTWSCFP